MPDRLQGLADAWLGLGIVLLFLMGSEESE